MIDITAFEAEITDPADVFIGPSRSITGQIGGEPYLYVVLPSFSFKVALRAGNLASLARGVSEWLPEGDSGEIIEFCEVDDG